MLGTILDRKWVPVSAGVTVQQIPGLSPSFGLPWTGKASSGGCSCEHAEKVPLPQELVLYSSPVSHFDFISTNIHITTIIKN